MTTKANVREFTVTRTKDNQQLGLSALIDSLQLGETVIFREVLESPQVTTDTKKVQDEIAALRKAWHEAERMLGSSSRGL